MKIGDYCFSECRNLSGFLILPEKLSYIGNSVFLCCNFSGRFVLPESIEWIGSGSFCDAGSFSGDLIIPDRIRVISSEAFRNTKFSGRLVLNNVSSIGSYAFCSCGLSGDLVIPSEMDIIPNDCFANNNFSTLIIPSQISEIESFAFYGCHKLMGNIMFPEGLVTIGYGAFGYCSNIQGIILPSTLQTIQFEAFNSCYGLSKIICYAQEAPMIQNGVFDGVAKDNFTVEVPSQSVKRYQAESGWGDFKRISAHYDFSISRERMRSLNGTNSKTYTLRCPSGFE